MTLSSRFQGLNGELAGAALNYDNVLAAMQRLRGHEVALAGEDARSTRNAADNQRRNYGAQATDNA